MSNFQTKTTMNKTIQMLTAVFIAFPLVMNAQTENPRGIYKMITLTGKMGEIKAPYEQYKICTDSVTLMVTEQGSHFTIINNDHQVFNYTGEHWSMTVMRSSSRRNGGVLTSITYIFLTTTGV